MQTRTVLPRLRPGDRAQRRCRPARRGATPCWPGSTRRTAGRSRRRAGRARGRRGRPCARPTPPSTGRNPCSPAATPPRPPTISPTRASARAAGALDAAKAQVASAQDALSYTYLRAGHAGMITARNIEVGQVAQAAQIGLRLRRGRPARRGFRALRNPPSRIRPTAGTVDLVADLRPQRDRARPVSAKFRR